MTRRGAVVAAVAIAALAALAVGAVRLLEALADPMLQDSRYATYAELQASAHGRSWLPDPLPSAARDICETHSLDTSDVCAALVLDAPDLEAFRSILTGRGFEAVEDADDGPPGWCPSTDCPGERFCADDAETLRGPGAAPGRMAYFALDRARGRLCYWTDLE